VLKRPVTVQFVTFRHVKQCSLLDRCLEFFVRDLFYSAVSIVQAMNVYRGSIGIAPLILNLGVSRVKHWERSPVSAE
jgi:hypothetical protein